jgi:endoglucanase
MLDRVFALRAALGIAMVALTLAGCSDDESPSGQTTVIGKGGHPLTGQSLYVDPDNPAAHQVSRWRDAGREADADAIERIASQPTAFWVADEAQVTARVRDVTRKAERAGRAAVLTAYHVPGRDCGSYSAGGSGSSAAYRTWVRAFARGIGNRRATVILEPDAIPQTLEASCLSEPAKRDRYSLLRHAVKTFAALPNTAIYIDAGNPGWVRPASRLVAPLRASGIAAADGFSLNVSNFYRTGTNISYGRKLSRLLGGAHFVIDTSRNGNGPSLQDDAGGPKWCNPPGRALGRAPSTETGERKVDAYLWVKQPGASDGTCRRGAPPAGQWWPEYALQLVRN